MENLKGKLPNIYENWEVTVSLKIILYNVYIINLT